MAYAPLFSLGSFDELAPGQKCRLVLGLVRALVDVDIEYLKAHPQTPALYHAGVSYRPQQTVQGNFTGIDHWWDIPAVRLHGEGSCEDLAAWRVAELQLAGHAHVRPFVHSREVSPGNTLYHIVVKLPDGSEEDPSALLGMSGGW
jgi:hypothetical protein